MRARFFVALVIAAAVAPLARADELSAYEFEITSSDSLYLLSGTGPTSVTAEGVAAAKVLLEGIEYKKLESVTKAREMYTRLIPKENIGGDYTTLQFFCDYILGSVKQREALLDDKLASAFCHFFVDSDYAVLREFLRGQYLIPTQAEIELRKEPLLSRAPSSLRYFLEDNDYAVVAEYLNRQYHLRSRAGAKSRQPFLPEELLSTYRRLCGDSDFTTAAKSLFRRFNPWIEDSVVTPEKMVEIWEIHSNRIQFLHELILFSNPRRETWDCASQVLGFIGLKAGDRIADIGSGSGYYSYKFSQIAGDTGKVYAVDITPEHIDFLKKFIAKQGIKNMTPVECTGRDICAPEKVDIVFMCSLFHVIYGSPNEVDRRQYIESIRRALRPGGRFVLVENSPVEDGEPLHGCCISKDLVIGQLQQYGFHFVSCQPLSRLRYMLTFRI